MAPQVHSRTRRSANTLCSQLQKALLRGFRHSLICYFLRALPSAFYVHLLIAATRFEIEDQQQVQRGHGGGDGGCHSPSPASPVRVRRVDHPFLRTSRGGVLAPNSPVRRY